MILIGENIHIISKQVREALEKKDDIFIKNLIKIQQNMDAIDLNVGPAKGKFDKIFEWLCPMLKGKNISFDSSNSDAIIQGLNLVDNSENCYVNSISSDMEKFDILVPEIIKHNCNVIALALSSSGIPHTADGRIEIIFEIFEKCCEAGVSNDKLFFDPLVLPLKVDQSQGIEVLNTIRMIKESFEPKVNTIIGLSNISNGIDVSLRPQVNRVFAAMCFGAGLDAAIVDAKDSELARIIDVLENNSPESDIDKLYVDISEMVKNFGDLEDITFDKTDIKSQNIIKTAEVLMNKKLYSDSFTQV